MIKLFNQPIRHMRLTKTNLTHRPSPRSLHCRIGCIVLFLLAAFAGLAAPLGSAITYQGRLNFSGSPAPDGLYDFRFTLHDAATLVSPVGSAVTTNAVPVTNGVVSVPLDFGATVFTTGEARWLEVEVNTNGLTPLDKMNPRQRLTPAPQALYAGSAATASSASSVAAGAVTSSGLAPGSVGGPAIADGSITSADLNASLLNTTFWKLGGNAGTTAGVNFLGTADSQTLELRAYNQPTLRLGTNGSVVVDPASQNTGTMTPGLSFGAGSGEGISSRRGPGTNQYGLDFYTRFQPRLMIASNGNVGVGTAAPAVSLEVNGGVRARGGPPGGFGANNNGYAFSGNGGDSDSGLFSSANGQVEFYANSVERMRITETGNIGIGTTTPAAALEIRGSTAAGPSLRLTGIGGTGAKVGIDLATYDPVASGVSNVAARVEASDASWSAGIDFQTKVPGVADSALASRLFIQNGGNVGIGTTSPSSKLEVNGTVTATGFSGNGAGLTSVNAANLAGSVPSAALTSVPAGNLTGTVPAAALGNVWKIGGNSGTGGDVLGTLDGQPMTIVAGNSRALSLETKVANLPGRVAITAVNLLGGANINSIANGVIGATIGGGGSLNVTNNGSPAPQPNTVMDQFGTVGGGLNNMAGSPDGDTANGSAATVAGGEGNHASGSHSFIGGGYANTNSGFAATVSGGQGNSILTNASHSTIAGGTNNLIQSDVIHSTISGGSKNTIMTGGTFGTTITPGATIGGGGGNTIQGFFDAEFGFTSPYATISGGYSNNIYIGSSSTIGGGWANTIYASSDTISGGYGNSAGDAYFGGHSATVPGGYFNSAKGDYSFAAGRQAKANHDGSFVWADSTSADFTSTTNDQFSIRASGGMRFASGASGKEVMTILNSGFVGINTWPGVPDAFLTVNGTASKPGGGSWSLFSDERLKKNIRPLAGVLEKLLALRGVSYEYNEPEKLHELAGERTGMIAQEVEKVFPDWVETGANGYKRLTIRGFEALTVEALRELREEKDAQIAALEQQNAAQQAINARMEARLAGLEQFLNGRNGGAK